MRKDRRSLQSEEETTRKCVDCGKKTTDYRCEECWAKIREEASGLDIENFVSLALTRSEMRQNGINL